MTSDFRKIINHLIQVGFLYQNSSIYNGLANAWDYGPLGATLKRNLKTELYQFFIAQDSKVVEIDTNIVVHPDVWRASGHIDQFFDEYVTCKKCNSNLKLESLLADRSCPKCGKNSYSQPRKFNLLFQTNYGLTNKYLHCLRPETSQGIFINFSNLLRTTRYKLPFGVGQFGKSFRNEITPEHMLFRTREFEQLELVYFTLPENSSVEFKRILGLMKTFLTHIQILKSNYRVVSHRADQLAHYAVATTDIEFKFPFGWRELWGLSNRGDYDLKQHQKKSGINLTYFDPLTHRHFFPFAIEPSVGIDRLLLAILCQAYTLETLPDQTQRVFLKLPSQLAPFQIMVTALATKLNLIAQKLILTPLQQQTNFRIYYDSHGSIGKKYRRADAIGVVCVITYDYQTSQDQMVTIRSRDNMKQNRISIVDLIFHLQKELGANQ